MANQQSQFGAGSGMQPGSGKPMSSSSGQTSQTSSDLGQQAQSTTDQIKQQASDTADQVMQKTQDTAMKLADQQKSKAAGTLGTVADALHQTGHHLESNDAGPFGQYAHKAADAIDQFADDLQTKSVDQMIGDVENFARREPGLFVGGAFVLGLLAARFLKSSTPQPRYSGNYGQQSGQQYWQNRGQWQQSYPGRQLSNRGFSGQYEQEYRGNYGRSDSGQFEGDYSPYQQGQFRQGGQGYGSQGYAGSQSQGSTGSQSFGSQTDYGNRNPGMTGSASDFNSQSGAQRRDWTEDDATLPPGDEGRTGA